MGYDPALFAGTAPYYWRYRPPYAEAAIDLVVERLGLTAASRLLDLGCGPGTLALRFAPRVGEVAAWDPDAEMLGEGRALAAAAGIANIAWRQAGSEELGELAGPLDGCVMGQSFHWMDRDQVMADLDELVAPGGGVALVNPGRRRPQEIWEAAAAEVVRAYLGERPPHPRRSPEPHHYPALERSAFTITDDVEFVSTMTRDFASCLGSIYSGSVSARRLFGDRIGAFEADLAEAIMPLAVDGRFVSQVETAVIVARR